jgi:surface antigen
MVKMKIKRLMIGGLVGLLVMSVVSGAVMTPVAVNAISKACQNSPECLAAVEREKEANKNAATAASTANLYQAKVSEMSAEIARKETEIAQTTADIKALKIEIAKTEEKLLEEQEALVELLVNMHFESDAEPIKILAGATSISDLAEKAAREEVVKEQISAAAAAVRKAKEKLESDKAEVEELLAQQEAAKQAMSEKRTEQQQLVEKFENDAVAYEAEAKAAQEAQRAAEKAEQDAHPERYRGTAYSGANTYPWQGDCPDKQDFYMTYQDGYALGGYVCECVSYAGWKAYEFYGLYLSWGNAYSWDDGARAAGYVVDHNPEPNTIGQVDGYPYGHVFWVESVNGDGSISVTEYNNAYATYLYSGDMHYGDFGARTISADDLWQYNFIHLK